MSNEDKKIKEELIELIRSAMDEKVSSMFDWIDDNYIWCEPDGDINHCISNAYPLGKWF